MLKLFKKKVTKPLIKPRGVIKYNSAEIIPAKLFFRILEGGDYSLLTDEKNTKEDLKVIWDIIEDQYNSLNSNKDGNKILNLSSRIEALSCKFKAIKLIVYHLRNVFDQELIDRLKQYGYKFTGDLQDDLDVVDRECEAIQVIIKTLESQMPKQKGKGEKMTFDETVLMYGAFTGLGYVDPNVLPLTQFDALINNGNKKMKALEKNGGKR